MGSLPDSKYIIQTDGYWFVEAHDVDPSKGYISVSAKGIVNGLSDQPNDGCDFGPDTYNPSYSGSGVPYTQTSGIQEASTYASNNGVYVKLLTGNFITTHTSVNVPSNVDIIGSGYETIITIPDGTNQYNIPFYVNSNTRISNMKFDMQYNQNANYTPSAIFIINPSSYIEIDNCFFDKQAQAWYIQLQATFGSSSAPTGYIKHVRIHNNIIHSNVTAAANESMDIQNCIDVSIYDNYFYYDDTTNVMSNGFFTIYDYSQRVTVSNNIFYVNNSSGGTHSPLMNFSDALNCEYSSNFIISEAGSTVSGILGIQNSSQYIKVRDNVAYGTLGDNTVTFGAFVTFGLGVNAVKDGTGGPDGNYSQNAGWNDFIYIENNIALGLTTLFSTAFTGNQNFTYLEVSNNTISTLRGYSNPFANISQNNGTFIYKHNNDISDLTTSSNYIGANTPLMSVAGTSSYNIDTVVISNNRFAHGTDFTSGTVFYNVSMQYITNLTFINNIMFNNSTLSSPTNYNSWFTASNITSGNIQGNIDGTSGSGLTYLITTPSVPTSGTPQTNSNPSTVNVYLYGGTVTAINYTPSSGSSTQVGTSGPATVRLNPGDSITLTYSAAPTWKWVAV